MGLLDVLGGMSNNQSGQGAPGGGGMSPITKAIIGVLAYQAIKAFTGNQASANTNIDKQSPGATGGGLDDLLKGGLGGLLGGGAAGSVVSGGLNDLLKQFQQNGHGEAASSWVGSGQNQDISENDLAKSIGADDLDALTRHTGLSRDDLLAGLRRELPGAVDELTPDGRVPSGHELSRRV